MSSELALRVNGHRLPFTSGQTVAAVLADLSESLDQRVALKCATGSCFACVVHVTGKGPVRACVTKAIPEMEIVTDLTDVATGRIPSDRQATSSVEAKRLRQPAKTISADIAIVGNGPAGLAASVEFANSDMRAIVLGVSPDDFRAKLYEPAIERGIVELRRAQADSAASGRLQILPDAQIYAAFDGHVLHVDVGGIPATVHAKYLLIASERREQFLPFKGWELSQVKSVALAASQASSGRHIVAVGTGADFHRGVGVLGRNNHIVRLCDPRPEGVTRGAETGEPHSCRPSAIATRVWREGAGVRVTLQSVDANWRPIDATGETVDCDEVCVGFGWQASTELVRLLECEMEYHPHRGGWLPRCDAGGQTSVPTVYACGDVRGVGSPELGVLDGRLAASSILVRERAGESTTLHRRQAELRESYRTAREAAHHSSNAVVIPPEYFKALPGDVVACPCEGTTVGQIRDVVRQWLPDLRAVKGAVRPGTGRCQGRICMNAVLEILTDADPSAIRQIGAPSVRPPLYPIALGFLANAAH